MKTLRVTSAENHRVPSALKSDKKLEAKQQSKLLELTPLWEQVTRTGKLPPETDTSMVFAEISSRLRDPEWEVRQHGLRVLTDLVPVLGSRRLDTCLPAVLSELISNLGHPSAAVRKGASDTLRTCIRESSSPDSVLRAVIARTNSDDRNVSLGVVIHIPILLDDRITHHTLAIIIGSLAKKLIQVSFQEHALKSLVRIRDMIGEKEFSKFLEKYHPQCKQDFDILCQVYEIGEYLSDSGIDLQYPGDESPPVGWGEDIPDTYDPGPSSSSSSSRSRSVEEYESSDGESEKTEKSQQSDSKSPQQSDSRPQTGRPQTSRPKSSKTPSRPKSSRPKSTVPPQDEPQIGPSSSCRPSTNGPSTSGLSPRRSSISVPSSDGPSTNGPSTSGLSPRRSSISVTSSDGPSTSRPSTNGPSTNVTNTRRSSIILPSSDEISSSVLSPRRTSISVPSTIRPSTSGPSTSRPPSSMLDRPQSGRIVLEQEIKFNEQTAITMTILEEEQSSSDEEGMYQGGEEDGMFIRGASAAPQRKESTRRVRFGGEEVLKTPPNSAVDRNKQDNQVEKINAQNKSESIEINKENFAQEKPSSFDDKFIIKPSLIPVRIPVDGGPQIKPVKVVNSMIIERNKPVVAQHPENQIIINQNSIELSKSPDLILHNLDLISNRPDILITKPDYQYHSEQQYEDKVEPPPKSPEPSEVREDSMETPKKQKRGKRRTKDRESPIPSLDGGDSLTGSSSDYEREEAAARARNNRTPEEETERVASALASLGGLEREAEDGATSWEDLSIVDASVMEDLRDRDDWRNRVRGAQQLKAALRNSGAVERLRAHLPEFLTFLDSMLEDQNPRVVGATLGTYARLSEALGSRLKPHVRHIAGALCRPAASSRAEVKMESAHAAKALMQALGPQHVAEALADHVRARNHRHREAALQLVLIGLLTFPSSEFDAPELARRVLPSLADGKRRVRQAALDCTAVLGQFIHPSALPVHLATERLRSRQSQDALHAAVTARLARRVLPALSSEGLILYSVQVPNHAARGLAGTPSGADVEWILAGSGSTSPGSARSRAQLHAATRRASSEDSLPEEGAKLPARVPREARSPRRRDRPKSEEQMKGTAEAPGPPAPGPPAPGPPAPDMEEQDTWTLVPVGALQDDQGGRLGLPSHQGPLWTAEIAGGDPMQGHEGYNRPMYLKLLRRQPEQISNLDKERGYILLPSKQLASTLGRNSDPNPQEPSCSPSVRGGRRVLEPLKSPEGYSEQREERTLPIPLRPTLARSSSSERRKMAPGSREGSASTGSSFDDHDSEGSGGHSHHHHQQVRRSSSLRRQRRDRRDRNLSDPTGGGQAFNAAPSSPQRARDVNNQAFAAPNSPQRARDVFKNAEEQYVARRGSPSESPEFERRNNPIPQKPVLARNNNNNNNNNGNNNNLRRPSVGSAIDKGDDVSHEEVVPIDIALGLLGGVSPRPGSTESRRRAFNSVDTTPPALGSPTQIRHQTLFKQPPDMTPYPPGSPRAPRHREPLFPQPEMTPDSPARGYQDEYAKMSPTSFHSRASSSGYQSTTWDNVAPQSSSLAAQRAPASPPLHSVSSPANLLEDVVRPPPSEDPSPASRSEAAGTDDLSEDTALTGGVVVHPLAPRVRPPRHVTTFRERRQKSSPSVPRASSSATSSNSSLVDASTPLRKPQDALAQCQVQLGSQEWEVVIEGLKTLERLVRHHPDVVSANLHSVVVDLVRQVRNLRSQVSRAACQAAGELAVALKRAIENELEELVSPLLHRSADTNKFLREDCGKALDKIMENLPPNRTIPAIISQGARHKSPIVRAITARLLTQLVERLGAEHVLLSDHKNAVVRATSARLLTQSVARLGADKVLASTALHRDVRTRLLRTNVSLLTEGSLETRTWAKRMFEFLMVHEAFEAVLEQSVPQNLLRSIDKTLTTMRRSLPQ